MRMVGVSLEEPVIARVKKIAGNSGRTFSGQLRYWITECLTKERG